MAGRKLKSAAVKRPDFAALLADVKGRIQAAQTRAVFAVNAELVRLYWDIGRIIDDRQRRGGWGAAVIPRLALKLKNELPDLKGFSERNIDRMISFFRGYPTPRDFSPPAVAKIAKASDSLLWSVPWAHHVVLMEKLKDLPTRRWYMEQTLANGWSRNVLTLTEPFQERELETELVRHLQKFLLELGQGFAFVGRQYRLDVGDEDFYVDLLFYHLKLRAFVVIDLKKGKFKPEYAGKLNFYCNVINDRLKLPTDAPTVGLILCQKRDQLLVEYSLAGIDKPIGISTYELTRALPARLQSVLPTVEEIEAELAPKRTKR